MSENPTTDSLHSLKHFNDYSYLPYAPLVTPSYRGFRPEERNGDEYQTSIGARRTRDLTPRHGPSKQCDLRACIASSSRQALHPMLRPPWPCWIGWTALSHHPCSRPTLEMLASIHFTIGPWQSASAAQVTKPGTCQKKSRRLGSVAAVSRIPTGAYF